MPVVRPSNLDDPLFFGQNNNRGIRMIRRWLEMSEMFGDALVRTTGAAKFVVEPLSARLGCPMLDLPHGGLEFRHLRTQRRAPVRCPVGGCERAIEGELGGTRQKTDGAVEEAGSFRRINWRVRGLAGLTLASESLMAIAHVCLSDVNWSCESSTATAATERHATRRSNTRIAEGVLSCQAPRPPE